MAIARHIVGMGDGAEIDHAALFISAVEQRAIGFAVRKAFRETDCAVLVRRWTDDEFADRRRLDGYYLSLEEVARRYEEQATLQPWANDLVTAEREAGLQTVGAPFRDRWAIVLLPLMARRDAKLRNGDIFLSIEEVREAMTSIIRGYFTADD